MRLAIAAASLALGFGAHALLGMAPDATRFAGLSATTTPSPEPLSASPATAAAMVVEDSTSAASPSASGVAEMPQAPFGRLVPAPNGPAPIGPLRAGAASPMPAADAASEHAAEPGADAKQRDRRVETTDSSAPTAPTTSAEGEATATAPAPAPFDKSAANTAFDTASSAARACVSEALLAATVRVEAHFAPSGRATQVNVLGSPYAGSTQGSCIAKALQSMRVPPFTGEPVKVTKLLSLR